MKNFLFIIFFLLNFYILPSSISHADEWSKFSCRHECREPCDSHTNFTSYWEKNGSQYSYDDTSQYPIDLPAYIVSDSESSLHTEFIIPSEDGYTYIWKSKISKNTGRMYQSYKSTAAGVNEMITDTVYCKAEGTATKTLTTEEIQAAKKRNIEIMKEDCAELGFTDGTEGMGNCVLKLMELENNSAPQVVTTNESPSNDNAMLEIERAKLKAEQERLEVEKQRAWIERQEQLNRIGTQSIDQGWCLMNGGGWGC